MAAFTALDPTDRAAFDEHWRKIRADEDVTVRTVLVGGAVAGHVASYVDAELGKLEVTYWIGREYWGQRRRDGGAARLPRRGDRATDLRPRGEGQRRPRCGSSRSAAS